MKSAPGRGLLLASAITLAWLILLIVLLGLNLHTWPLPVVVGAIFVRTLLQTGLFIVGHDGMHGVLLPASRLWNDRLAALALTLYAWLPYRRCRQHHRRHHLAPATAVDPDVHPDPAAGPLPWYLRFMAAYLGPAQLSLLVAGWALLGLLALPFTPTAWLNVLLFCVVPLLASSIQLFVFGTYLPHRRQRTAGSAGGAESLELPEWLSLLACYHFGYHSEHHDHPALAWFELPRQRRIGRIVTVLAERSARL
ncbi:MAG: fatty acid desaturase [Cyanobium sp.]